MATLVVLISIPVDRYNDKPCTGAESYFANTNSAAIRQ